MACVQIVLLIKGNVMKKHSTGFWLILTILLSAIFVVLFYPGTKERLGSGEAIMYTIAGVMLIWIVFFLRARIFSKK
jgi:hypothetical protein